MRNFILFLIALFFLQTTDASAARFFASAPNSVSPTDITVSVPIFLDTEGERINVVAGEVTVPASLEFMSIESGNSSVNLWIEPPMYNEKNRTIKFSGMIPGGVVSADTKLFSIKVLSEISQVVDLTFSDVIALRHDGLATPAQVTDSPQQLNFSDKVKELPVTFSDYEPPELFTPEIITDSSLSDGETTLVWSTTDKSGSGVVSYVRVGLWGRYREASSPYVLGSQSMDKTIYIKVIDESGNARVVKIAPQGEKTNTVCWWILPIMLLIGYLVYRKVRRNK
jgi:hypothetical protein